jgi:lysophospholipase L1-like esterase
MTSWVAAGWAAILGAVVFAGCHSGDRQAQEARAVAAAEAEQKAEPGAPPPYKPHRLDAFFRALMEVEESDQNRTASILHVGDSHTASDTITGRLRGLFQQRFGDAGRGYAYPGRPWRTFRQERMTYDMGGEWESIFGTRDRAIGPFALGGVRLQTSEEGAWVERASCTDCRGGETFDRYALHYLIQPDGGSLHVQVDDRAPTVVETDGSEKRLGVFSERISLGTHRIRVTAQGDGPVALFGLRTHRTQDGVVYHSLGINGATAPEFASFDRQLTRSTVRELDPDLLVVAFGTNEAFNFYKMGHSDRYSFETVTQAMAHYNVAFRGLLERYRSAAPQAACLVLLPPDLSPVRSDQPCRRTTEIGGEDVCVQHPIRHFSGVVAAQRYVAQQEGCAVWDQTRAMGGAGSMAIWSHLSPPLARKDRIHLTMSGYDLMAESLFNDVIKTYDIWKRGGDMALPTTPIQPRAIAGAFGP